MNLEITSRHFSASDKLKTLVQEKISKIEKYNSGILNYHVILTKEGNGSIENVEIVAHSKGHEYVSHDNSNIFEQSLTNAIQRLKIQITKHNSRITEH